MFELKPPVDDILFSLEHVAGAASLPGWDGQMTRDALEHFAALATDVLAPLNAPGDREGARLENGRVRMPRGFGDAYRQLAENGWQGLGAPEEYGGMGASPVIEAGISEIFTAANHSLQMVTSLVPGAIALLRAHGNAEQQSAWIPRLASGELLSTMCLTESGAGSDLSAIRCAARKKETATGGDNAWPWVLSGEKIFISGGDQDMSEGILHLVLARSDDADSGIGGLSLFLCCSGGDGDNNGDNKIRVTRIEEKLGLHASPTCQLVFDDADAALIGREGDGLKIMFTMMNRARLDVALQGVAHAARVHGIAADYAAERKQGRRGDGAPAMLCDHADVARMLARMRALAIGARGMCHIALVEAEKNGDTPLAEFLTSLCKIFATGAGIEAADTAIQILGGYGYLEEYAVAQHWRDVRITAIYEGANGIHARNLATRGLRGAGGGGSSGADGFADMIAALAAGDKRVAPHLAHWQTLRERIATNPDSAEALAHAFAEASGALFYAACWARIDAVAENHPGGAEAELHALAATVPAGGEAGAHAVSS